MQSVDFKDYLRLQAIDLSEGDTKKTTCPNCLKNDKLYITRVPGGLLYHCFYSTCPIQGFAESKQMSGLVKARSKHIKSVTGNTTRKNISLGAIPMYARKVLRENYCITDYHIQNNQLGWQADQLTYYVFNLAGSIVGSGKKTLREFRNAVATLARPAHILDVSSSACGVYFPRTCRIKPTDKTCVLVEGWLDAIRVGDYMPAGALLGTHLTEKGAAMLARHFDNLLIMLDPDTISHMNAVPQAKILKKYGAMFDDIKVIVLKTKDPKDLKKKELREYLGV